LENKIGKIGVCNGSKKMIPMEVVDVNGNVVREHDKVLERWKYEFESLLNPLSHTADGGTLQDDEVTGDSQCDIGLSRPITMEEVRNAIYNVKKGKASGDDGIPGEVIQVEGVIETVFRVISTCFSTGRTPKQWGRGIITPIPKSGNADPRDPLSYRGITLTSVVYKIYCSVLNTRLTSWCESEGVIVDEQNGFRKGRSTVDHLSALTNIVETRKKLRLSTFCAFIDFKKAYDTIDRGILWQKLQNVGVNGCLFRAVKSLYEDVKCCVKLNGFTTEWFDVKCGLKQGCPLSPMLFNIFINDLALRLKAAGKGVLIGDDIVSILLYADDIVVLAENPEDLQSMLDVLNNWCITNSMSINTSKSNVVHFRPGTVSRCSSVFVCGESEIALTDRYKYLGLVLTEHLDFAVTAKAVAQSANRALGLVIAKAKSFGGVSYSVFTKLFESVVCPVIAYGAAIWGTDVFSCINSVQYRAARFFLNVNKHTANAAVSGDTGWTPMDCRLWKVVGNFWCRMSSMASERVNKKVMEWACVKGKRACKNWPYRVKNQFTLHGLNDICDICMPVSKSVIEHSLLPSIFNSCTTRWKADIDRVTGKSGKGGNKLRTYRLFKNTYCVDDYCRKVMSPKYRGALAKFRTGTAPIRIETGRYECLPVNERKCFICDNVEDEQHVLIQCPLYEDLRFELFNNAMFICPTFNCFTDSEKLCFILSNGDIVQFSTKTCWLILERRRRFL
jgi:hypothetical protein